VSPPRTGRTLKAAPSLKSFQRLFYPLSSLKGIGAKRAESLARKGLHSIIDLLLFLPLRYEDRRGVSSWAHAGEGVPLQVSGQVLFGKEERYDRGRKRLFRIRIREGDETLDLLWFHYRKGFLASLSTPGTRLLVYGRIKRGKGGRYQMIHPDVTLLGGTRRPSSGPLKGYVPVYSSVKGVSNRLLGTIMERTLEDYAEELVDPVPGEVLLDLNLPGLAEALKFVHRPSSDWPFETLNRFQTPFHRRLLFDRFFLVAAALQFLKRDREKKCAPTLSVPPGLMDRLRDIFPFTLTPAQQRSIRDISADLARLVPMNRLLLGDVGCGKTAVAAAAVHIAALNGKQAALMVPTRILAEQHMEFFSGIAREMRLRPLLVTGENGGGGRGRFPGTTAGGTVDLVIGTHALLRESLEFPDLGLVIIDEQHRFGVRERAALLRKGKSPHQLVMSATPIPRTLAMTLYGDMDISIIDARPPGYRPVKTRIVTENEKRIVFDAVREALKKGRQCFVVCPAIEGPEGNGLKGAQDMAERLLRLLHPPFRVGLIHGRMAQGERESVMEDFRKGRIDLLVGTTVLEVGIHVPNATVMVIEHPERFGLAQLHQLRGRVGRGKEEGTCFLVVSRNLPERVLSRLKIIEQSSDGFYIARKDMELRGPGNLTGLQQAGIGELDLEEVLREQDLLFRAREAARRVLDRDPDLSLPEHAALKAALDSLFRYPMDVP